MSVSIGFFTPSALFTDTAELCRAIREEAPLVRSDFPFVTMPVEDEKGDRVLSYAVIAGHVPIHIDRRGPKERTSKLFTFVLDVDDRPVLLCAPANSQNAKVVFDVDQDSVVSKTAFGAIELRQGMALHFDIQEQFHGITGFPTGETDPDVRSIPNATLIQVPWERADDIQGAIYAIQRTMSRDDRFQRFLR